MVDDRDRDHGDTLHDANSPTLSPPRRAAADAPSDTGSLTQPLRAADRSPSTADLDGSRYRLLEVLGHGGMGEVVLAFDEQIGREVAVKRIRSAQPSAEEITRFVREARVQGRLEHPAVVPVHDLAIDRTGAPFFVMKRLAGTDLKELLDRLHAGAEPDEAGARRRLLRAFVDVCLAVEFAHSRNIIHRDLKPANIMLGDFGEVYVLDWGIARTLDGGGDGDGDEPSAVHPGELSGSASGGDGHGGGGDVWQTRRRARVDLPVRGRIARAVIAGGPLLRGAGAARVRRGAGVARRDHGGAPPLDGDQAARRDPADRAPGVAPPAARELSSEASIDAGVRARERVAVVAGPAAP